MISRDRAHWAPNPVRGLLFSFAVASLALAAFGALVPTFTGPVSFAIYDRRGILLGAKVADDGQWRLAAKPVPEKFERAIVAFEDRAFWTSPGVNLGSILRATAQNLRAGKIVSGGSTLTMQTVRLARANPPRTVAEKIREIFLALILELARTKRQILEQYAANAPFGGNVVGLEAAAWRYYNLPADSLTWAETATLAVLPNQPALVHPGANRDVLLEKRNRLLRTLRAQGALDEETLELALAEPLPAEPYPLPRLAPHYLERLKRTGRQTTFIDRKLQVSTTALLERWSDRLEASGIRNAACLVIDTETGEPLAYVGNTGLDRKNNEGSNVDIVTARRSSGSLLKPFLYAASIDGGLMLPQQLVPDVPTRIGSYKPENNVPTYRGVVPADEALSRSLNVPAVRELRDYGVAAFREILRASGFSTLDRTADEYGLPLILGGGEITMDDAVHAYARLMKRASRGDDAEPYSIGAAWLTLEALVRGARPEDEALWQSYAETRKIAWKTGTSYGNRDAWAIGTTPRYTVGVWVGNATGEGRPELKSATTAAPILFDVFDLLPKTGWIARPESELTEVTVCADSGFLAGPDCARAKKEWKPKNAAASPVCPWCRTVSLTPDGRYRATANDLTGTWSGSMPLIERRFVLPPVFEYWYRLRSPYYRSLPPWLPGSAGASASDDVAIAFPEPGARIYIPIMIDGTPGETILEARHRVPGETLYWDIDGEYLGQTKAYHQLTARPGPGRHVLTVTDTKGNRATSRFEILTTE